jgi:radical SAM protein with 4Fe4S-binding SPASM domain
MAKINKTTWATPTIYGLVFSHIDQQHDLKRVYLDNEAVHSLLQNNSQDIVTSIEEKGVNTDGLRHCLPQILNEKNHCDELVTKHNWHLFSLYPLQLSVQTLNYCNANCDFCYANAPRTADKKAMDLPSIYSLKDYAASFGVKFGISGGEPLLHPQIYEILSYRKSEVFDTLITNLTAAFDMDALLKTQVDLIQVSLHGYGSIHDKILGVKEAYITVKKRMGGLMERTNVATNTVITPSNIQSVASMLNDLSVMQRQHGKKLTYVRFVPVVPSGTGFERYEIQEKFIERVKTMLLDMQKKYPDINFEIPMIHANPYEYFHHGKRWICPAGSTVAVVRIDGHIIPCNQFLDTSIHSRDTVYNKEFHKIWLYDELFSHMRKGKISTGGENTCNECMYLLMKQHNQLF